MGAEILGFAEMRAEPKLSDLILRCEPDVEEIAAVELLWAGKGCDLGLVG
jgi:hypothetical protein